MSDDGSDEKPAAAPLDVVVGVGKTSDGEGVQVVRLRDEVVAPAAEPRRVIEVGELRRMETDAAIPDRSEVVRLKPRADGRTADVEVVVPRRALSGPAQYATAAYRENWSATFETEPSDDDLN